MSHSSVCHRHEETTVLFDGIVCPLCESQSKLRHLTRQHEQFRDEVEMSEDRTKE
jgi:hypothetical protein